MDLAVLGREYGDRLGLRHAGACPGPPSGRVAPGPERPSRRSRHPLRRSAQWHALRHHAQQDAQGPGVDPLPLRRRLTERGRRPAGPGAPAGAHELSRLDPRAGVRGLGRAAAAGRRRGRRRQRLYPGNPDLLSDRPAQRAAGDHRFRPDAHARDGQRTDPRPQGAGHRAGAGPVRGAAARYARPARPARSAGFLLPGPAAAQAHADRQDGHRQARGRVADPGLLPVLLSPGPRDPDRGGRPRSRRRRGQDQGAVRGLAGRRRRPARARPRRAGPQEPGSAGGGRPKDVPLHPGRLGLAL